MNNFPTITAFYCLCCLFFTRYVKKLHLLVRLIFTPNWNCKLKDMFSVLLRLIHFPDFQQVAHTTVLKVHKKTCRFQSSLQRWFCGTLFMLYCIYIVHLCGQKLFLRKVFFFQLNQVLSHNLDHTDLFFGKEILAIILFSESFSSDTEPEKMKYLT